jgi:excisionase family DNA binding protein
MPDTEPLWLLSETAERLRCSPDTLRDYVQTGRIECHRTGRRGWIRFTDRQIADFLEATRVPAGDRSERGAA